MNKEAYETKQYVCEWCGNEFERIIVKGTSGITSQVQCRSCGSFIKT